MFSEQLKKYAQEKYEKRLPFLESRRAELEQGMSACSEEERILMRFFYGTMPLRDAGEYGFDVFLGFVRHSLMVYRTFDWCRDVPEDMFINYILYYRINTENIEDCRKFFYDQLFGRIQGLSAREAALEINYWCAENGTYETTDSRTISPMTLYRSGKGRCGEESIFAVTAFRSVGIPARQVYTPRWAHCDDNHAWVEVYVDGGWHFLGACEPEEILDKGWFTNASSRALLIETRTFSDYSGGSGEECLGREGLMAYYNGTSVYARTKAYEICVKNGEGRPVENAHVSVEILNMAEFYSAADLLTDAEGKAVITLGLGDVRIHAWKDGLTCTAMASVKNSDCAELVLGKNEAEKYIWRDTDVEAPEDYPMHPASLTREQKEKNRGRIKTAVKMREERIDGYFDEEKTAGYPRETEILRLAAGNFDQIYEFLSRDKNPDRALLLHSLTHKDYRDAKAEILERHLEGAAPFRREWEARGEMEIYVDYILCPRVLFEEMTDYRDFLINSFSEEERRQFRERPSVAWKSICARIGYDPELDYPTICSTPVGCMKMNWGNLLSKKILFVALMRSIGVPARINPINLEAEYHENGSFIQVSGKEEQSGPALPCGVLKLRSGAEETWNYYQNWTIGVLRGERFVTLDYTDVQFEDGVLVVTLEPGVYRLITSSRLPSGNQLESEYIFDIKDGTQTEVQIRLRSGSLEDLLVDLELDDFDVTVDGEKRTASRLTEGRANMIAFLAEGQEPTEHVLNEMMAARDALNRMDIQILFLLQNQESLENRTVQKVLDSIKGIRVAYCNFDETVEPLARRMYVDPDKLPLLILTDPGLRAVYGCSGYNVGSVDLMMKLLSAETPRRKG